jgi:phasin
MGDGAVSESEVKAGLNGANGFRMPLFGFPSTFGELAEFGLARAQEGCEKMRAASEDISETLRETYASNARSATDYGMKLIEISRTNTAAAIDFVADLLASKSASDVLTLSATQARKAFDSASSQNRELWDMAQRLATETSEPIRRHAGKVFRQAS